MGEWLKGNLLTNVPDWFRQPSFFDWTLEQGALLAVLGVWIIAALPSFRFLLAQATGRVAEEIALTFPEKIWIFILFIIAAIFTVLAGVFGGIILLVIAAFFTLLATFWWLFEDMLWPWESEFWDLFFEHPWLAFLFGGLFLVAGALLIAILVFGVVAFWPLFLIGLIVVLWWCIFVLRCGWIVWLDTKRKELWVWWKEVFWDFIEVVRRIVQAVERWVTRKRREWRQIRVRRCASWHWALRWLCTGFTYVMQGFWYVVEYAVKIIVYIVSFVIVVLWFLVTVIVGLLIILVIIVLRVLFWCW